ncbi:MAG: permease [Halofilum sp. (in: g-proteobacteria)]
MASALLALAATLVPRPNFALLTEVGSGLLELAPVVAIAAALAGALAATDLSERVSTWMGPGPMRAIGVGSLAGALTPVCGLGIVPLIAVLLRRELPLSAVMAFWIASPITDPGMLVVTAGILGWSFAGAKTLAAFGAGMLAGFVTHAVPLQRLSGRELLRPGIAAPACEGEPARGWRAFAPEALANARLIARWLVLALVLEVLVQRHVPPELIESLLGSGALAVPLAAIAGAPLYLDGYAALPLVRGFAELGTSAGAVMALLMSGAAVSLYAAVAVYSLVRWPVFLLYVALAIGSAVVAGYAVDLLGVPIAVD